MLINIHMERTVSDSLIKEKISLVLKPLQHMYTGKTMRDLHWKTMATLQLK